MISKQLRQRPDFKLNTKVYYQKHTWRVAFYGEQDGIEDTNDSDDFDSLSFFDKYDDALDAGMKEAKPTFWPNMAGNERIGLDRCTRLFPQDQDSGGFFLALIKRIK